jgi:hypothetical protein
MTSPTFVQLPSDRDLMLFACRHTVAVAVQASGNDQTRHHSAWYRTSAYDSWDINQVSWSLADKMLHRQYP